MGIIWFCPELGALFCCGELCLTVMWMCQVMGVFSIPYSWEMEWCQLFGTCSLLQTMHPRTQIIRRGNSCWHHSTVFMLVCWYMLCFLLTYLHFFFFSLYRCLFASVSSPLISNSPQKTYGLTNNLSYLPFTFTIVKYIRLSLLC